jgi:hypothetical protein
VLHTAAMKLVSFAVFSLGAALALGACGSDDDDSPTDEHQTPAECKPITDACHHTDDGVDGPAHECHENAHEVWTAAECTAEAANCIALCEALAGDSGTGGAGGGASGAAGAAGHDEHDH